MPMADPVFSSQTVLDVMIGIPDYDYLMVAEYDGEQLKAISTWCRGADMQIDAATHP